MQVGFARDGVARVERPRARVEARHLGARGPVAVGEQLRGARVARDLRDVVEADQRLHEAVDDPQARPERVLHVVRALRRLDPHAGRRRLLEHLQPVLDARQQLRHPVELGGRTGDRLQAGALRQAGDPRRPPTVEREVVLPREPAAARHGHRQQLVEQLRVGNPLVPGLRVRVEQAEVGQRMELEPLARHVLPDELGVLERDALAGRRQRLGRPPLAVALERQEQRVQARRAQRAARRHALDRGQDAGELRPASAGQAPDRALDVGVDRAVGVVGRLVDRAARVELLQLARDRLRRLGGTRRGAARSGQEHAQDRNPCATGCSYAGHCPMLGSPRRRATCCNPVRGRSFRHHRSLFSS